MNSPATTSASRKITADLYRSEFCPSDAAWSIVNLIQHALDNGHRVRLGAMGEGFASRWERMLLVVDWDDGSTGRHQEFELGTLLNIIYIEVG